MIFCVTFVIFGNENKIQSFFPYPAMIDENVHPSHFWGGVDIIYKWRQFLLRVELKSSDESRFGELKYMVSDWYRGSNKGDMTWFGGFGRTEGVKTLSFSTETSVFVGRMIILLTYTFAMILIHLNLNSLLIKIMNISAKLFMTL